MPASLAVFSYRLFSPKFYRGCGVPVDLTAAPRLIARHEFVPPPPKPRKTSAPAARRGQIVRPTFRRERARDEARASGRSRAATRPGGGRSPARWSPPRSFSIPSAFRAGSTIPRSWTPKSARSSTRRSAPRAEVAVAIAPPARIDRDNILRASLWALARAVAALPVRPKLVFVDGRDRIDVGCECQAVISGDALVLRSRRPRSSPR